MTDQTPATPADAYAPAPSYERPAGLHTASGQDASDELGRDVRFQAVLARGDRRDQAAEYRDRRAEDRGAAAGDTQGWIDRAWAGRDRDAAAADRTELLELLNE